MPNMAGIYFDVKAANIAVRVINKVHIQVTVPVVVQECGMSRQAGVIQAEPGRHLQKSSVTLVYIKLVLFVIPLDDA